ncbi:MAG: hypothetical protein ACK5BV_06995 [Bacteroidota bacterium]|jgi:hypothetical protein
MNLRQLILGSLVLIMFSASIVVFNISCNKESDAQQTNNNCIGPQPKFQFKANGVIKNCDAIFNPLIGWDKCPVIQYFPSDTSWTIKGFIGWGQDFDGEGIYLEAGGAPMVKTYENARVVTARINNIFDSVDDANGSFRIVITSITNNRATGTFSGQLRTSNGSISVQITEGVFSNIPVGLFDWGIYG